MFNSTVAVPAILSVPSNIFTEPELLSLRYKLISSELPLIPPILKKYPFKLLFRLELSELRYTSAKFEAEGAKSNLI